MARHWQSIGIIFPTSPVQRVRITC